MVACLIPCLAISPSPVTCHEAQGQTVPQAARADAAGREAEVLQDGVEEEYGGREHVGAACHEERVERQHVVVGHRQELLAPVMHYVGVQRHGGIEFVPGRDVPVYEGQQGVSAALMSGIVASREMAASSSAWVMKASARPISKRVGG